MSNMLHSLRSREAEQSLTTLFLDRDGVINRKVEGDYVRSWDQFEFLPGSISALSHLAPVFDRIIVLTNQRGIALGFYTKETLQAIHNKMCSTISEKGGRVDAVYYCPHGDGDKCGCRKPAPGLAKRAKEDFPEIDFRRSIVIGDSSRDVDLGRGLGMVTVGVGEGDFKADLRFPSLHEAALEIRKAMRNVRSGPDGSPAGRTQGPISR